MKLTPKQKKFCEYYAALGNATEAARKAGYSEKTARSIGAENLTKPDLQAYIRDLAKAAEENRIAHANEVLAFFTDVMRDAKMQAKDRLRAAEALARRFGLDRAAQENDEDVLDSFIDALKRSVGQ